MYGRISVLFLTLILCQLVCLESSLVAQQSYGGSPIMVNSMELDAISENKSQIAPFQISEATHKAYANANGSTPLFALPIDINQQDELDVAWLEKDGGLVGLIRIALTNNHGAALKFENFQLGSDDRLFIYNRSGSQILGAYTASNKRDGDVFMTDFIRSDEVYLEVFLADKSEQVLPFTLDKIYKVMNDEFAHQSSAVDTGFLASRSCHENVLCEPDADISEIKNSIVRVMMVLEEGVGWCSGTLMNNTNEDRMPYILSAFHCQDGFTPLYNLWRFDFNFEAGGCAPITERPDHQALQGCQFVAGRQETDFILLKINESIPASYNPYYAGWDRRNDYEPRPSLMIHHPAGDIKKIAVENDDLRIWNSATNWDNDTQTPAGSHFRLHFENGSHEPGSSGAALFDSLGRVVAQLHGGNTNDECSVRRAYLGRISQSWNADAANARLVDWLDPNGSGTVDQDGIGVQTMQNTISVSGQVLSPKGEAVPNVTLTLGGDMDATIMSDANGNFNFNSLPAEGIYTVSGGKGGAHNNGLSATDLAGIITHIVGTRPFTDNIKILAADVNDNGSVSATDLVQIQNVILGLKEEFNNGISWGFEPSLIVIDNGNIDPQNLNIIAYKKGDVNFTADPLK